MNFDEDRFRLTGTVDVAGQIGVAYGANLAEAATWAIGAVLDLHGGGGQHVAAQFTYHGREYLAVDLGGANNLFNDWDDLLVEITGATGTIGANDFI